MNTAILYDEVCRRMTNAGHKARVYKGYWLKKQEPTFGVNTNAPNTVAEFINEVCTEWLVNASMYMLNNRKIFGLNWVVY